jgi:hypothetical protein
LEEQFSCGKTQHLMHLLVPLAIFQLRPNVGCSLIASSTIMYVYHRVFACFQARSLKLIGSFTVYVATETLSRCSSNLFSASPLSSEVHLLPTIVAETLNSILSDIRFRGTSVSRPIIYIGTQSPRRHISLQTNSAISSMASFIALEATTGLGAGMSF